MEPAPASAARGNALGPFPPERIPKNPVLSGASFGARPGAAAPCVLDAGEVRYVNRGCMAIGLALAHAGVGAGDEVLLPAYHCISMVEPVIWRRARPVFFRIREDTSIDLDDLGARISARSRALLAPHYFGFPQDMPALRAFCDARGLLLIEDCAHAFFGAVAGKPVGAWGDYAVASVWKFFPVFDGGVLASSRRKLEGLGLRGGGAWFQAKALVNTLEMAFEYRRLGFARALLAAPLRLKDHALRGARRGAAAGAPPEVALSCALGGWGFDPQRLATRMSLSARAITRFASRTRIVQARRDNYERLLEGLRGAPGCRPLFPSLPAQVVPQVFPLLVDAPEPAFSALKRAGVPIIRFGEYLWEGMDRSTCPVAEDLSRRVFQFPCHQELLSAELDWMIERVREALLPRVQSVPRPRVPAN
ncbi:MAG: DegT/DnrJ/EryC1/StrS aminotransferase family protein [Burkholderiales bacterium]|nr:DegT/DnrJ/EryC1/StrS aminotransferase family protein [Burkholderiales bacterium]